MQQLAVVRQFLQVLRDCVVELARLPDEDLLHAEEVPVLPNRLEKVVEKVVKLEAEVVPDKDDVVAQLDFVLGDALRYVLAHLELPIAYLPEGLLDLGLEGLGEIKIL